MVNWDWMLPGLVYSYPGVDGLKTGTTDFAGYCFTGTAMRNGERFITVVQNATNASGQGGYEARFAETKKLLDYAFNNYSKVQVLPSHYQVKGHETIPVVDGKQNQVQIYTSSSLDMAILNGDKNNYRPVLVLDKSKLTKNGELAAPIKKGEKIGYVMLVPKNGQKETFLTKEGQQKAEADVVAAQDVPKANWFILSMRSVGGFFGNLFGGIASQVKGWFK